MHENPNLEGLVPLVLFNGSACALGDWTVYFGFASLSWIETKCFRRMRVKKKKETNSFGAHLLWIYRISSNSTVFSDPTMHTDRRVLSGGDVHDARERVPPALGRPEQHAAATGDYLREPYLTGPFWYRHRFLAAPLPG